MKRDDVIAGFPREAVRDGRECVRSVSHERDLLRSRAKQTSEQFASLFFHGEPTAKIERAVFVNVSELRFDARGAGVVALRVALLTDDGHLVAAGAPRAGERARVDVRAGAAQEVAVPDED